MDFEYTLVFKIVVDDNFSDEIYHSNNIDRIMFSLYTNIRGFINRYEFVKTTPWDYIDRSIIFIKLVEPIWISAEIVFQKHLIRNITHQFLREYTIDNIAQFTDFYNSMAIKINLNESRDQDLKYGELKEVLAREITSIKCL